MKALFFLQMCTERSSVDFWTNIDRAMFSKKYDQIKRIMFRDVVGLSCFATWYL